LPLFFADPDTSLETAIDDTRVLLSRVLADACLGLDAYELLGQEAATTDHSPREGQIYHSLFDPTLSWKEIEWLLSLARVPVLLKGILSGEDAARAAEIGVAGVIVSNHGARNLDTVPATIEVLPEVVEAVAGRLPVLMDGGIRRGTDVLKALALGAQAVLLGRAVLWGLATGGADGVAGVLRLLARELQMAMALAGRRNLAEIDRTLLG
ncbi:MAG TPA: alpha-hydroxy acid oxidase, partial [Thermoanaerobaculia bacterium]|nr:alpha-hydroxy acid oxidase [Thermoanaerobaculia bacterium]